MHAGFLTLICAAASCAEPIDEYVLPPPRANSPAASVIVGAAVVPHGDFAFAPELVNNTNGSLEVHRACTELGAWIDSLQPTLIVLSTPHGMALDTDFLAYLNTNGSGFAAIGQDLHDPAHPPVNVPLGPIPLAPAMSSQLVNDFRVEGRNVSGIRTFADSEDAPLRWSVCRVWASLQLGVAVHPREPADDAV